jgi:hypothetical protein
MYISEFKRNYQSLAEIEVGGKIITETKFNAGAFAENVSSIFKSCSSVNTRNNSDFTYSDF